MTTRGRSLILVDGHVHLRNCFDTWDFLHHASENFARFARREFDTSEFVGMLFVADAGCERGVSRLKRCARGMNRERDRRGEWTAFSTRENRVIGFSSPEGRPILIVPGRQVESSERLEVLAIGTRSGSLEGSPVSRIVEEVARGGGIPIVPWGAGKWWGARGRIVRDIVREGDRWPVYLGDSANRPRLWPRPRLLNDDATREVVNLPGSDPLPRPGDVERPGSFGFALEERIRIEVPVGDLFDVLAGGASSMTAFGERKSLPRFLVDQCAMQVKNTISS